MNREELIQKAVALGRTPEDAAKIADAWIAKQDESKGEKKPTPKATPAAKAPPKVAAAKTPEPPKPSPAVAAQVPKVGAKVYGAEAPDKTREYSDVTPPMTRSRAAEVMPGPEVSLMGRGGLWLDREAAAKAQAEDRARAAAKAPAPTTPSVMKYADEADMRAYGGMGDVRRDDNNAGEVAGMRAALRSIPRLAEGLDDASDEDVRAVYEEEIIKARR